MSHGPAANRMELNEKKKKVRDDDSRRVNFMGRRIDSFFGFILSNPFSISHLPPPPYTVQYKTLISDLTFLVDIIIVLFSF